MDNALHEFFIQAAAEAGHPVRMISGDKVTWADDALPDSATQEAILADARMRQRKQAVRGECRRRIYAQANQQAQTNMGTAQGVIAAKDPATRTDEERQILAGVAAALVWVGEMRTTYRALAADTDADYLTDTAWPECPAEVIATVALF